MRRTFLAALLLTLAVPALAQPTLDSHGNSHSTGGTTTTIAVTTSQTNDIVLVATDIGINSSTVPTATISGCGLTWSSAANNVGAIASFGNLLQMWQALATSTLSACTVTITSSTTIDDASTVYCSFHGTATAAPLDNNGALPVYTQNLTGTNVQIIANVTTTQAHDQIIAVAGTNNFAVTYVAQSPATLCDTNANSGGVRFSSVGMVYSPYTSAQTATAVGYSSNTFQWRYLAHALTADAVVTGRSRLLLQ